MESQDFATWRKAHSLTAQALADLLGVSVSTVWRWERGERDIPPYLCLALETLERRKPT